MNEKTKASIQNQKFGAQLIMKGISAERATQAFKDYLPSSQTRKIGGDAYGIVDHMERTWTVFGNSDNSGANCHIFTPPLAYEDMDEFLYLIEFLKEQGAEGGEGYGMRLFASMEDQPARTLANLRGIVSGKLFLLDKVLCISAKAGEMPDDLGSENLVEVFPYVMAADFDIDEMKATIQLACAVSAQAINQNRVVEKQIRPENERYYFRCWLLRAGLIGDEYKKMRMRFLKRLEGSSSYKEKKAS